MATLSYALSGGGISGSVEIKYSLSYNPLTNKTTVTFEQSSHTLYGIAGWGVFTPNNGATPATQITVTAADNTASSAASSFSPTGSTTGGSKAFYSTPSPVTCVVEHAAGAGTKAVIISAETKVGIYYAENQSVWLTGDSSATETAATAFTLTFIQGAGCTMSAKANGRTVRNGEVIVKGEILTVTFAASEGYSITSATLNGAVVNSGGSVTVTGNVTFKVETIPLGGSVLIGGQKKTVIFYSKISGEQKQIQFLTKINGEVKTLS